MGWMKQMKKLTRNQKIRLAKEGKDPKDYMWCERMQAFIRKGGKQEDVADRPGGCRK
jgi:hypothetical protein